MIITHATLEALRTSVFTAFQRGFESAPSFSAQIAMQMPSNTAINTYGFLEKLPKMREWVGPRVIQNLKEQAYQLANKDWELTIGVDRNAIEDDNLGIYAPMFAQMGMSTKQLPDDQFTLLLENGHDATLAPASVGYDSQPIFSVSHDIGGDSGGAQSNYLTNKPLSADNYATARAAMRAFKGYDGRPLGVIPDLLMVPPALEKTALLILNAEMVSDGTTSVTNVYRNTARLIVNPFLTDATDWYLFASGGPIKPFIHQVRRPMQFVPKDKPGDDNVFTNKEFLYGVDSREAFGVALWWFALKCKGEA